MADCISKEKEHHLK